MALNKEQLIALARANAKASLNPSQTYSFEGENLTSDALNKTFIKELNGLGATPQDFRENKNLIYTLLEVGLTEVLPTKVLQSYGQFADVKTFAQGTRPVYKIKISEASKKRAKQFVTRVGLAGRYEVFKLDGYSMEVPTAAYGGAENAKVGSWGLVGKYYNQGAGTFIAHTSDGDPSQFVNEGFCGYSIGANYTVAKNIIAGLAYYDFKGRETKDKRRTLWTEMTFAF